MRIFTAATRRTRNASASWQRNRWKKFHRFQVDGRAGDVSAGRFASIRYAEACVKSMRDAVGDSIDIMSLPRPPSRHGDALRQRVEPYDLFWFEEPCCRRRWTTSRSSSAREDAASRPASDSSATRLPRAAGKRAASVIQPDITHCGGLSEARRICGMARRTVSPSRRIIRRVR